MVHAIISYFFEIKANFLLNSSQVRYSGKKDTLTQTQQCPEKELKCCDGYISVLGRCFSKSSILNIKDASFFFKVHPFISLINQGLLEIQQHMNLIQFLSDNSQVVQCQVSADSNLLPTPASFSVSLNKTSFISS